MSANFDGDSEMLSSSESESPLGACTPTYTKHAELSPPGSQTGPSHQDKFGGHDGDGDLPFEPSFSVSTADNFGKPSSERVVEEKLAIHAKEAAPGASWNNQRAQEEYNRAMEHVVDRNFSLGEFGDPFDESDMLQGASGV